jgi:hypothetical protein
MATHYLGWASLRSSHLRLKALGLLGSVRGTKGPSMSGKMQMFRLTWLLVVVGFFPAAPQAKASGSSIKFPQITSKNLNDRPAEFPSDLPGAKTLILIAFQRKQQVDFDGWISKLGLKKRNGPAWIEMPVVADYGSIWRSVVYNGMRSGITNTEDREHVYTVYGKRETFMRKLNIPTSEQVYVLVVRTNGQVLARVDGRYSQKKADVLLKAMLAN